MSGSNARTVPLMVLFGALYFVQGMVEPTASLPAQPLQTWLEHAGHGPARIGHFFGFIGLGWSIKPLYGLCSDFFPLFGTHRKGYLGLSTLVATLGLWVVSWLSGNGDLNSIELVLFLVGVALATTDVVVDALAVEQGQALGLTGRFQAVQWGASSTASVLSGVGGGWLASNGARLPLTFGVCAVCAAGSWVVVVLVVREPKERNNPRVELALAMRELQGHQRLRLLLAVAAFLFLLNFNPFSTNVLKHYTTEELGLSEQMYGNLVSVQALASIAACVAYAWYCKRVAFGKLVHASIATAVLSTAAYWMMQGPLTAVLASATFGAAYQTSGLITLDLAARSCPRASAATVFACLMAVCNWGLLLGVSLGGGWYEALEHALGNPHLAFDALVGLGALTTATGWFLAPTLKRYGVPWQ